MSGFNVRVAAALSAPLLLSGCQVAVVGNSVVLGMALGLFLGTLQLGRRPANATARDDARSPATTTQR